MKVQLFAFEEHQVRFVGTAEVPEWVGADIVNVLYPAAIQNKDQHKYLGKVPQEWKGRKPVPTLGGTQEMITLYESGLYYLICRADSPLAIPFQKWVYEDVIPAIRKTGSYTLPTEETKQKPEPLKPTLEEIEVLADCARKAGVNPILIESVKLEITAKEYPHLRASADEFKRLISAQMPIPEIPVKPTSLGEILAEKLKLSKVPSAIKVNQALESLGLQHKEDKNWLPTEAGKPHSELLLDTTKGHNKTVYILRWFSSVVPLLEEHFQGLQ